MEHTREISIKRQNGVWGGLVDSSSMLPSPGTFETLKNCYLSRDGTEIRRWLGSKLGAEIFCGVPLEITAATDNGGNQRFQLRWPSYGIGGASNAMVYVLDSPVVADGYYTGTTSGAFVTLDVAFAGTTAGGWVFTQIGEPHLLTHAENRPIVVGQTAQYHPQSGANPKYHLASWVGSKAIDPSSPETPNYAEQTGSSAEAVDTGVIFWPSPHMHVRGVIGDKTKAETGDLQYFANYADAWDKLIYSMNIKGRMMADVLNNRVLIAVPGHGCMFEVNVQRTRLTWQADDILGDANSIGVLDHRYTKALGIPKGRHNNLEASTAAEAGWTVPPHFSAARTFDQNTTYYAAVAYMDPFTGEVGLASELRSVSLGILQGNQHLHVDCLSPRSALRECANLIPVAFVSVGDTPAGLLPVRGLVLENDSVLAAEEGWTAIHDPRSTVLEPDRINRFAFEVAAGRIQHRPWRIVVHSIANGEELTAPRRFPILEQMPVGASWVRVVRGRMFSGGTAHDDVKMLAMRYYATGTLPGQSAQTKRYFIAFQNHWGKVVKKPRPSELLCDGYKLSSAYEGHFVAAHYDEDTLVATHRPWLFQGRLGGQVNDLQPGTMYQYPLTMDWFEVDENPFNIAEGGLSATTETTYDQVFQLVMQPDLVQYSEEGFPGIVASNRLPVDSLQGKRPTGMARIGDEVLVFTERSAHLFMWGLLPRRATSRVISNQYGCIASDSVIEADGMAAWCSEEGPVAYYMGQGLSWISRDIQDLWRTFVSQTSGMRGEIQGIHDASRGLFIWQVTTEYVDVDGTTITDDDDKPKQRCNRYLVYTYGARCWSLVETPEHDKPYCIQYMPIHETSTGKSWWTPCFVAADWRSNGSINQIRPKLYMMDERYQARRATPISASITGDWDGTTTITASSLSAGDLLAGDEAFIYSQVNKQLRWTGSISAINSAGSAVASSVSGITGWKIGDTLQGGVISMSMTTNLMRLGELGAPNIIHGIVLRLVEYQDPDANYTAVSFAKVRVEDEEGTVVNFCLNPLGDRIKDGVNRFKNGTLRAEQFKIHIDVYSNVQVRLKDVAVEIDAST